MRSSGSRTDQLPRQALSGLPSSCFVGRQFFNAKLTGVGWQAHLALPPGPDTSQSGLPTESYQSNKNLPEAEDFKAVAALLSSDRP